MLLTVTFKPSTNMVRKRNELLNILRELLELNSVLAEVCGKSSREQVLILDIYVTLPMQVDFLDSNTVVHLAFIKTVNPDCTLC